MNVALLMLVQYATKTGYVSMTFQSHSVVSCCSKSQTTSAACTNSHCMNFYPWKMFGTLSLTYLISMFVLHWHVFLKNFLLFVCVVDLGQLWGETSGGGRASFRGEGARGKLQTSLCHWNHRHPALLRPGCRDRYLEIVVCTTEGVREWQLQKQGKFIFLHLIFQVYNFRVGLKRQLAKPDRLQWIQNLIE